MTQHTRNHAPSSAGRSAFTLIELLVVIAIIALLMTLAFPAIAVMQRLTQGGTTETTIGVAVRTAAAYAAKPKPSLSNPYNAIPPTLVSNGAAVIFTPSGDIRVVEADPLAAYGGIPLQAMSPPRYGYKDVANHDYITLPGHAGVVGIVRRGGQLYLLAPPFAVRFDRYGQISTGSNVGEESHMVFYKSKNNTYYDVGSVRPSSYDPSTWDSRSSDWDSDKTDNSGLIPDLPFEQIETVVGVLMFNMNDFKSAGHTLEASGGNLADAARDWLRETKSDGTLKNAKLLFFSRNSGAILREYR